MTTQPSFSMPESARSVVQVSSELQDVPNPDRSPTQTERPLSGAQIAAAETEGRGEEIEVNQVRDLITPEMLESALLSDGSVPTDRSPTQTERELTQAQIAQLLNTDC